MNNVAYLGIDVSKGYADFILLNPNVDKPQPNRNFSHL